MIFVLLLMAALFAAMIIFIEKDLFKAALGLAVVFASSAGIILLLGQPLIALFQLLILVGGLSTYLIVAVASEGRAGFLHTNMLVLSISFIVLGGVLLYAIAMHPYPGSLTGAAIGQSISLSISEYYPLMYAMVFLLFSIGIGSILLMRRVIRMVV